MKLSRIRIEQFRQFRQPLEITGLEAGVNLFTGPNEAGKSTLAAAIRAAFFERHRSGSVEDFRPWGDSSASPTVALDFTVGGDDYRLTKSFLSKKRCELQIGPRQLDGIEAEDHLAALLGFEHASKGASKAEHWGIPGLLWIEQGAAHDIRASVSHAADHLRAVLTDSLGEVASSGGDEVLSCVEEMRNELLTPTTGTPRGTYNAALKQQDKIISDIKQLDEQIAAYRQNVDALASLRREHAADEVEKPWEGFREQQRRAEEKLSVAQRLVEALATDRQRVASIEDRIELLRNQLDSFSKQEQDVEKRRADLESAQRAQATAATLVKQWQEKLAEAQQRNVSARSALRMARQENNRRSLTQQRQDMQLKADSIAEVLAKAETAHTTVLALQSNVVAEVATADLASLRKQDQQLRELKIRQHTVATRLQFVLDEHRSIQIGDESLTGAGDRLLTEVATVTLPGLGKLEITPGGADLAQLKHKEAELTDRHAALLQRLGLASLEAADQRLQTYNQHQADLKTATATLKALAPRGIEALRSELATCQARTEEFAETIRQLPSPPEASVPIPSVAEAEAAEEDTKKSFDRLNDELHNTQIAYSNASNDFESATRELANAQALLDSPDRTERLKCANQNLTDALAERAALSERIEEYAKQVADARPEILKQDIERYRRSAEQHEKQFTDRRDTLMRLEIELESVGAQGLDEHRAELARDCAQTERRVTELKRRAVALDYLLNLLREKRSALTRRLQAPLQKHLNRYLQLLFPQASLEIDENLAPGPLTRINGHGSESGAFEALSFGAREQMGVISRLAYADLLKEAGRPTLIILDDALVHSDEARLAQMKRVLFDAATRHQILLLTCHPARWRDLGVGARALESMLATT